MAGNVTFKLVMFSVSKQLYWMALLGPSVDQNWSVTDGACCYTDLDTSSLYGFEISLMSSRAN